MTRYRRGEVDWQTMQEHDRLWRASEHCEPVVWYACLVAFIFAAAQLWPIAFAALTVAAVALTAGQLMARIALDRNRPFIVDDRR